MAQVFRNTNNRSKKGGPAQIILSGEQIDGQYVGTVTDFSAVTCVRNPADGGGFTESAVNTFMEASVPYDCRQSLKSLQNGEGVTVTFQLSSGSAYTMRNAWFAGTSTGLGSDSGQIGIRFESEFDMEERVCQDG